jgi:hypothetical protein
MNRNWYLCDVKPLSVYICTKWYWDIMRCGWTSYRRKFGRVTGDALSGWSVHHRHSCCLSTFALRFVSRSITIGLQIAICWKSNLRPKQRELISGNRSRYITAKWWHKLIERLCQPFTLRQQHQDSHDHSSWLLPIYQHILIASLRFAHL